MYKSHQIHDYNKGKQNKIDKRKRKKNTYLKTIIEENGKFELNGILKNKKNIYYR